MAVNKVELYVSQILEDLDNGLTWFKKDDLGYGSIQEKYNAKDIQIMTIKKHPALKDAETNVTVFTVIDDTNERNTTTVSTNNTTNDEPVESVPTARTGDQRSTVTESLSGISNQNVGRNHTETVTEPTDAFFSL